MCINKVCCFIDTCITKYTLHICCPFIKNLTCMNLCISTSLLIEIHVQQFKFHKYLILISFPEQHLKYQCFTQYSHFIIVLYESLSVLNSTFTENASYMYCKDVVLVLQHQRWWHLSDLYSINGKFFNPYFSDFPSLFDDLKTRFYISCTCREGIR